MSELYKKYAHPFKKRVYIPAWFIHENSFPSSFDEITKKYPDKKYKYVEILIQKTQMDTDKAIQLEEYSMRICSDERIKELEKKLKESFPDEYKKMIRDTCYMEVANSEQWIPKSLIRE